MHVAGKVILAKEMLKIGFYARIISQETKLSKKVVVRLAKRALAAGDMPNYQHRPGREPTGAAIIKNVSSKMHASVVMGIYAAVGGENIIHDFNFKALSTAFRLYVKEFSKTIKHPLFDVNNMWYLAKELRERTATLENCSRCRCRYFHSINQRMNIDCPFCFVPNSKSKETLETVHEVAA